MNRAFGEAVTLREGYSDVVKTPSVNGSAASDVALAARTTITKRTVNAEDVRLAYLVFHLQTAIPNSLVEKRVGADGRKFISLVVGQSRFQTNVVARLNAGAAVWGESLTRTVSRSTILWLADLVRLPGLPDLYGTGDVSWEGFFRQLLLWPEFLDILSEATRQRVRLNPKLTVAPRTVVGEIDGCYGTEVTGWAMSQNGEERVVLEFVGNGVLLGSARCNEFRRDLQERQLGDGKVGFRFIVPPNVTDLLGAGHCRLVVRDSVTKQAIAPPLNVDLAATPTQGELADIRRSLDRLSAEIDGLRRLLPSFARQASYPLNRYEDAWEAWLEITPHERRAIEKTLSSLQKRPRFSVLVSGAPRGPVENWPLLASLKDQIYEGWEVILAGEAPDRLHRQLVHATGFPAGRAVAIPAGTPGSAEALNAMLAAATGDYVCAVAWNDRLAPDALAEFALGLSDEDFALLYADEDQYGEGQGRRVHRLPYFKPGLDRDLLLQQNYIGGLTAIAKTAVIGVGGYRGDFEGVHEYDLVLRVVAALKDEEVKHLAAVLCHRAAATDADESRPSAAALASRQVAMIQDHLDHRLAADARVRLPTGLEDAALSHPRIDWGVNAELPAVSIIIPTRDRRDLLEQCLTSVKASSQSYGGEVELIVVDNQSTDPDALAYLEDLRGQPNVKLLGFDGDFNWSLMNNMAAEAASGTVLIFLNNDTVVSSPNWIHELAMQAMRPEVGAVGAKLMFGDGSIQHAGVLGGVGGVAVHDGVGFHASAPGYFNRNELVRGVLAVTGACMAVRAALFQSIGGFNGAEFKIAFNDLDLCLRLRDAGYRVIFTPYAVLFHYESKSRGIITNAYEKRDNQQERARFGEKWGVMTFADPFYNPNFDRSSLPFSKIRPIRL